MMYELRVQHYETLYDRDDITYLTYESCLMSSLLSMIEIWWHPLTLKLTALISKVLVENQQESHFHNHVLQ